MLLTCWALWSGCEGDYLITYRFTGLDAIHAENTGRLPAPTTLDTIPANAYVLRLLLFPEELSRKGRYLDRETPPDNVNPIRQYNLTSNADFDAAHPKGTSLLDLFQGFDGSFFADGNSPYFYDSPEPAFWDFLLLTPPTLSRSHVFTASITLADGTQFIDSTTTVYLR